MVPWGLRGRDRLLGGHRGDCKKSSKYATELEAGTFPLPVEQFPIQDYGIPDDIEGIVDLASRMVEKLRRGRRLVCHCAAGCGRTGMFAAMVLVAAGMSGKAALAAVRAAGSPPEMDEQNAVVEKVVARLADGPGPERKKLVLLTGAGISAESGIRTFRVSDGLWNGVRIEDMAAPRGWRRYPANVLAFFNQRRAEVLAASPNAGHL